jgi:hypothetical protein
VAIQRLIIGQKWPLRQTKGHAHRWRLCWQIQEQVSEPSRSMLAFLHRPCVGRDDEVSLLLLQKGILFQATRVPACLSGMDQELLRAGQRILPAGHIDIPPFDKSSRLRLEVLARWWFDFLLIVQSLYVNRSVSWLSTI